MGNGPCLLTRACLAIVAISGVVWTKSTARPQLGSSWNNTRNWKRELADKEGYFTNTWAVEIDPAEEHVVADIAKRHGFSVIGQVGIRTHVALSKKTSLTFGNNYCLFGCGWRVVNVINYLNNTWWPPWLS